MAMTRWSATVNVNGTDLTTTGDFNDGEFVEYVMDRIAKTIEHEFYNELVDDKDYVKHKIIFSNDKGEKYEAVLEVSLYIDVEYVSLVTKAKRIQ